MQGLRRRAWMTVAAIGLAAAAGNASDSSLEARVEAASRLIDVWIGENLAYHQWPSVAVGVVHGGELVWAKGYGTADAAGAVPVTATTRHRLGSVSKVFTATLVMILRDQGKLALDDPITRFLPGFEIENPFPGSAPISVRHLLTHTAGLPREGAFPYWATHVFPGRAELLEATAGQSLVHPPGTTYKYSNLGVALLGAIVEEATGLTYAEALRRHLLEPLGMANTTAAPSPSEIESLAAARMRREPQGRRLHTYYDTGAVAAAANVVSTVADLSRFAALHLGYRPDVLAERTRLEMQRLQFIYPSWSGGRGLGFAVSRDQGKELVSHGGWIGGHRSQLTFSPGEDLAVIVLTSADDVSPAFVGAPVRRVFAEHLSGPDPLPNEPAWSAYEGRYTDPWGWEYTVMALGGELVIYDHNYPPDDDPKSSLTPLTPIGPHLFRMDDGENVRFEVDAGGRAIRFIRRVEPMERIPEPPGP